MAKLSTDELLDAFKEMTLIELSEFVKQFEETFGVTAAAPVAVAAAAAPGAPAAGAAAAADQDELDDVLQGVPAPHPALPKAGQGARRGRPEADPREGHQGSCREGQGGPRGRRRH